jgi:hypothetical protein
MKTKTWITHFHQNKDAWTAPDWQEPCSWPTQESQRLIGASLATFQQGETGDGSTVKRLAWQAETADPALRGYAEAVRLFIAEENAHAALLAQMVERLGTRVKTRDASASAFRWVRKMIPLVDFELQILLIAEIIALAYYGLLSRALPDSVLQTCCAKLVRDEVAHISFHVDFFRYRHSHWLPGAVALWQAQFQALYLGAETFVWLTHGKALSSVGVRRTDFTQRGRRACADFLRRMSQGSLGASVSRPDGAVGHMT